jgi:hypothetical protein
VFPFPLSENDKEKNLAFVYSFLLARATVCFTQVFSPSTITLIAMGYAIYPFMNVYKVAHITNTASRIIMSMTPPVMTVRKNSMLLICL